MSDPRITKLPKWVQDHIAFLERRTAEAEAARDEARLQHAGKDSRVQIRPYDRQALMLPEDERVRFYLGPTASVRSSTWLDFRFYPYDESFVEVMASDTVVTQLHSSNLFRISTERASK